MSNSLIKHNNRLLFYDLLFWPNTLLLCHITDSIQTSMPITSIDHYLLIIMESFYTNLHNLHPDNKHQSILPNNCISQNNKQPIWNHSSLDIDFLILYKLYSESNQIHLFPISYWLLIAILLISFSIEWLNLFFLFSITILQLDHISYSNSVFLLFIYSYLQSFIFFWLLSDSNSLPT